MGAQFSFDIVSEVNMQEVDNAINQAQKELAQRFDFKNSKSSIDYDLNAKKITLIADDDFKLRALKDILEGRMAKRSVSLKCLTYKTPENAFEGTLRQVAEITSGMPSEKAKEIVKIIKDAKLKVQASIEGEKVRVSSQKKDELQAVISLLRNANFSLPLQFTNYR
ncbi:MAG: YajQ family cyclic di-GMP-binding protein [Elusimicrobia bacterium RIFOXYA2_FULL_50_26]|nr:MAG: YajQ family cyclic di-GMP-binding protein [Elusimicrobia bacterium RIFOXYA2_FULL_50_26]OGS23128.1 MAG: YajQ family cyclic di-GMP-binding protein [Elusimicrobia bacterium RIFOXYB2_FULL_50_12]